jgi:hypothetical protein
LLSSPKITGRWREEVPISTRTILIILVVLFLALPFLIVHFTPATSPEPYVFRAHILEKLRETLQGKLGYFLVEGLEGSSPAAMFVVTIDSAYTRGSSRLDPEKDRQVWMQGSVMTPDVFYGEHYLFFGYPQLYISQVKTGALWPTQIIELRILYLSPLTAFLSLVYIFRYPFMEEFSLNHYFVMIAQSVLIVAMIVFLLKRHQTGQRLALVLLAYSIIAMLTTIPMLPDLY